MKTQQRRQKRGNKIGKQNLSWARKGCFLTSERKKITHKEGAKLTDVELAGVSKNIDYLIQQKLIIDKDKAIEKKKTDEKESALIQKMIKENRGR